MKTSSLAACNHLHSVEERLSRWLMMIYERATMKNLPLTQELISRRLGAHRSRMPFKVMQQLISHPLTDKGLDQFLADWRKVA